MRHILGVIVAAELLCVVGCGERPPPLVPSSKTSKIANFTGEWSLSDSYSEIRGVRVEVYLAGRIISHGSIDERKIRINVTTPSDTKPNDIVIKFMSPANTVLLEKRYMDLTNADIWNLQMKFGNSSVGRGVSKP
jgi:hypothetical protein